MLLPPDEQKEFANPDSWEEVDDASGTPDWFDKAARFDAFGQMRDVIREAQMEGNQGMVIGKLLILSKGAVTALGCRVYARDSQVIADFGTFVVARAGANVTALRGSYIMAMEESTTEADLGANVAAMKGSNVLAGSESTVSAHCGSKVKAEKGSHVIARPGSKVEAYVGSFVVAECGSHVAAIVGSYISAMPGSDVTEVA